MPSLCKMFDIDDTQKYYALKMKEHLEKARTQAIAREADVRREAIV